MSDSFFGGTNYLTKTLLTGNQQSMLDNMNSQYNKLGGMADRMQSTYQGSPETYFQDSILSPLRNQYQDTLSNLDATGKRHSSFNVRMKQQASQSFLDQVGSQRANWLNQERLREMQAAENLRQSQMNLYGLQNSTANTALGTRAFENIAQQDTGMLGKISSLMNLGGSVAGSVIGM